MYQLQLEFHNQEEKASSNNYTGHFRLPHIKHQVKTMEDLCVESEQPQTYSRKHIAVRLNHFIVVVGCCMYEDNIDHMPWTYNLYTEEWRKYFIPKGKMVPINLHGGCGVVIGKDIYIFVANFRVNYDLWKLSQSSNGVFAWSDVSVVNDETKKPSPRVGFTGWEYAGNLWIFGGYVKQPPPLLGSETNQVLQFDIATKKWSTMKCFGEVPAPRCQHATSIFMDKVWLFGGEDDSHSNAYLDELYELDPL